MAWMIGSLFPDSAAPEQPLELLDSPPDVWFRHNRGDGAPHIRTLPQEIIAFLRIQAAALTSEAAVTALITAGCLAPRATTWAMLP